MLRLRVGMAHARGRGVDIGDEDPPTGSQDAQHLADRERRILEVHQHPLAVDRVERRIREWQVVGIALDELDLVR